MDQPTTGRVGAGNGRSGDHDHASSDDIRRDIDRTRSEMDRTVDALEDRLRPGRLLEDAWSAFRSAGGGGRGGLTRSFTQTLTSTIRENPVPILLVGAGLGWLLVDSLTGSDDDHDPHHDDLPDRYRRDPFGPGVLPTGEAAHLHEPGSRAGDDGEHGLRRRARHGARRAQLGFWQAMDRNPLAVGTATLALGVLAGLSVPATEAEDELLGAARDEAIAKARRAGRRAVETAGEVADRAVQAAARKADEEGWSTDHLAASAREVGREAKRVAKEEARRRGATVHAATEKVEAQAEKARRTGQ